VRRFYYFGCRGKEAGHFIHGSQHSKDRDRLENGFPVWMLDGTFTPLDRNDRGWRLTQLRFGEGGSIMSILSCHDNTIDTRGGSNVE
jgi:hypothetical protein